MSVLSPAEADYQMQHISDDKSKQLLATCVVSSCVASGAVALRITARRVNRLETSLQADDYMTIIAFVGKLRLDFHRQAIHTGADTPRSLLLLILEDNFTVSLFECIGFCFLIKLSCSSWNGKAFCTRHRTRKVYQSQ